MATDVHRLPTLPVEELLGDKRSLKPFARRIGRPDCSITFDEYIRFLEEYNDWYQGHRNPEGIRSWFEPIAAFYATFPTWQEGRRALILGKRLLAEHYGETMTAEQLEMRRQIMEVPVLKADELSDSGQRP